VLQPILIDLISKSQWRLVHRSCRTLEKRNLGKKKQV